jgi:putative hydrolase of the HAD superfamily
MLDWKTIDTVMLDMDGTLLDLNFDNYFWQTLLPRHYADKHGLSFDEARQQLIARYHSNTGTLAWYCLDYWQAELDIDLMILKHEIKHLIKVLPHTIPFLDQVRKAGKRTLLVTNAHHDSLALKMERTNLVGHFDAIICSHDYGYSKEQLEFWQALGQRHLFDPKRTVMVDDNLDVLHTAVKFGIGHVVAIRKPDSQRPENEVKELPSVAGLDEITP